MDNNENPIDQEGQSQKSSDSSTSNDKLKRIARQAAYKIAGRSKNNTGGFVVNLTRQAAKSAARALISLVAETIIAFLPWILAILGVVIIIIIIAYYYSGADKGSFGGAGASGCWYGASSSASTTPTSDILTQDQAMQQLRGAGISIQSSGNCTDKNNPRCTSLEGVRQNTINGIINFKQLSGASLTITGGTETGHAGGAYSHGNGYKLDISSNGSNDTASTYIKNNLTYIGQRAGDHGGPGYKDTNGNEYVFETELHHWDITFSGGNSSAANNQQNSSNIPGCDTSQAAASASASTCGGKYSKNINANWMYPRNFGDPSCDFSKQAANEMISQIDSSRANFWFAVMQCESGYNPNSWLDPNSRPSGTCSPDAGGAWGLVQDGSSASIKPESMYVGGSPCRRGQVTPGNVAQPPGASGGWGHGGPYDRGDVDWRTQLQNAVQLLNIRGKKYWACAKNL